MTSGLSGGIVACLAVLRSQGYVVRSRYRTQIKVGDATYRQQYSCLTIDGNIPICKLPSMKARANYYSLRRLVVPRFRVFRLNGDVVRVLTRQVIILCYADA